jgi:U3 small nucleolar RNA-associated protein 14
MQNFRFNHKLVVMVLCLLSTKGQGAIYHRGGEIVGENFMMGQIFEELVEEKNKACTMDGKRHSKPSSPNWKLWCVMDSKHNKCALVVEWK